MVEGTRLTVEQPPAFISALMLHERTQMTDIRARIEHQNSQDSDPVSRIPAEAIAADSDLLVRHPFQLPRPVDGDPFREVASF